MTETHETLEVQLGDRSYEIHVGANLIDRAGEFCAPLIKSNKAIIVTDSNVASLYLDRVKASLKEKGVATEQVILPAGESTKAFGQFQELCETILSFGIERKTMLIALGGGVIGDITGFAASVILRGLDFIQIPTTLLAQVDSSVGGKTGINTGYGKNLVGSFHQPRLVLADIDTLDTLPRRQLLAGYAEVVKYGLIDDFAFFEWLEINGKKIIEGDKEARKYSVLHSCEAKAKIVAEDEKESGKRALLNLGHTFGHAYEAETGYGDTLLHGEAVAIGIHQAYTLSTLLGLCPSQEAERVSRHLENMGLETGISRLKKPDWTSEKLAAHMDKDKKVSDGKITFVMAKGIGQSFLTNEIPRDRLIEILNNALNEKS
ncbi:MAG: 3-dehydroquinate synthase [Alphaproteobacteria bacterium]|nr:3-dehydroquinate synthase [Alphaproteobacteria bacterium]